jgi:hypothetical protein
MGVGRRGVKGPMGSGCVRVVLMGWAVHIWPFFYLDAGSGYTHG